MPNARPDEAEPSRKQQEVERWLVQERLPRHAVKWVLAQQTMLDVDRHPVVDGLIPLPGGRNAQMPQSQPIPTIRTRQHHSRKHREPPLPSTATATPRDPSVLAGFSESRVGPRSLMLSTLTCFCQIT